MGAPKIQIKRLEACRGCGYAACICKFKAAHSEACTRRRVVLSPAAEQCAAHGVVACSECWPCDCGRAA